MYNKYIKMDNKKKKKYVYYVSIIIMRYFVYLKRKMLE